LKKTGLTLSLALLLLGACTKSISKIEPVEGVLNLAYLAQPQVGIIHIALEKGFFEAEGLTVKARSFEFGKPALSSAIKRESDLSISAETPLVFATLTGERIGIAAVIGTWDKNLAIVANRAAGIQNPSDLAGKAIGVTKGTSGEYFLETFLLARGIRPETVQIIDTQPESMLEALLTGQIAAATIWIPLRLTISDRLAEQAIVFFGEDFYTEHIVIAGTFAYLKDNPRAMAAFMRAIIKAEDYMRKNTNEAATIISKHSGTSDTSTRSVLELINSRISLDQSLLLQLEDETRWALRLPAYAGQNTPNWMDHIHTDTLDTVAPDRVRIIR